MHTCVISIYGVKRNYFRIIVLYLIIFNNFNVGSHRFSVLLNFTYIYFALAVIISDGGSFHN